MWSNANLAKQGLLFYAHFWWGTSCLGPMSSANLTSQKFRMGARLIALPMYFGVLSFAHNEDMARASQHTTQFTPYLNV